MNLCLTLCFAFGFLLPVPLEVLFLASLWRSCLQCHFYLMLASFLISILDMGAMHVHSYSQCHCFFTCACLIKDVKWKKKMEIKLFSIHPVWQPARLCRSGCTRYIRCQIAVPRTRTCVVEYIAECSTPTQALPSKRQTRPGHQYRAEIRHVSRMAQVEVILHQLHVLEKLTHL